MTDYKDPTHVPERIDTFVGEPFKKHAKSIRQKMYGKDVRESLAQSVEEMGHVSQEWDNLQIANTEDLEVKNARTSLGGVAHATLKKHLDSIWWETDGLQQSKADRDYVNAQLSAIASGTPRETFAELIDLKTKYPNGAEGVYLVLADGNTYYWNSLDKAWVSLGTYQAPVYLVNSFPQNIEYWHTMKVNTNIGDYFSYNGTVNTVENTDMFYYTGLPSYGPYSTRLPIKSGIKYFLKGSASELISIVYYDQNGLILETSEWANEAGLSGITPGGTIFYSLALKNRDNSVKDLNDVLSTDCLFMTDTGLVLPKTPLRQTEFNLTELYWQQGAYRLEQGKVMEPLSYGNYRVSSFSTVPPSTEFDVNLTLAKDGKTFRYVLYLLDSNLKLLNNSGWITSKSNIKLRTTPDTHALIIMAANTSDSVPIKLQELDSFKVDIEPTPFRYAQDILPFSIKDLEDAVKLSNSSRGIFDKYSPKDWVRQNIAIRPGSPTSFGASENRAYITELLEPNSVYLFNMKAPFELRFTFGHSKAKGDIGIYDSFWHWGPYRYKTGEVPERLYVVVSRKDDGALSESDFSSIIPTVEKLSDSETNPIDSFVYGRLIMHRGASLIAPEDTVPALIEAAKNGAWASEMDVQYTKDGHAVIMHDATVDRTTDGTGAVKDLTLAQIKALTVTFGPNIEKYPGLKVPTLDEMIAACKKYNIVPVLDSGSPLSTQEGTLMLQADLERLGIINSCVILTQGTVNSCNFRYYNQDTLMIAQYAGNLSTELELMRIYRWHNAFYGGWNFHTTGATDESLTKLWQAGHKRGLKFYAITNDQQEASKWIDNGCDFLSSDDVFLTKFN